MTRFLFTISMLVMAASAAAQPVLVPYKDGKKMGLSDQSGKIIIKPTYDYVRWVGDHFFETQTEVALNDTIETSPHNFTIRKNLTTEMKSVIYNGKVIIKNEPYDKFNYFSGKCIIAYFNARTNLTKEQNDRIKNQVNFYALYNLTGENVYPDNFMQLKLRDSFRVTNGKKRVQYVVFTSQDFDRKEALFVYDCDKQMISDWLLKSVGKIKSCKIDPVTKVVHVQYEDANHNAMVKAITFNNGRFVLTDAAAIATKPKNTDKQLVEFTERNSGDMDPVAVPDAPGVFNERPVYNLPAMYELKHDSVFYRTGASESVALKTGSDMKFILLNDASKMQIQPLIYKKGNSFGIITKDSVTAASFDSLFYFGDGYLAYRKNKCGIIARDGSIKFPFIYDSIQAIKQLSDNNGQGNQIILADEKNLYDRSTPVNYNQYKKSSDRLLVFQKGKVGMISMRKQELLPVMYDTIMLNSDNFSGSRQENKYILLKKNGRYGIFASELNLKTGLYEKQEIIAPVFPAIPSYYLKDYYDVIGFRLFALHDVQFKLTGFASDKGILYFKQ